MIIPLPERLLMAAEFLKTALILGAPKDTWNLSLNSIRIVDITPNDIQIVIGGETAPYARATNEQWVSERWKGKQNPNQGWVQDVINSCVDMITQIMSGAVSPSDYENAIKGLESGINEQFKTAIAKIESEAI